MRFECDERKRLGNLARHGLDFVEAEEMFGGPMLVAFSERDGGDTVRVISLRKALRHEREAFEEVIGD